MAKDEALQHFYNETLDSLVGAREAITEYTRAEAQYRDQVLHLYRTAGWVELADQASRLNGFAFGSLDPYADLQFVATDVERGARSAGYHLPPVHVGYWPDQDLNARTIKRDGGAIVYLNVGTPTIIRGAALLATLGIRTATGMPTWDDDYHDSTAIADEFEQLLSTALAGQDVHQVVPLLALAGLREGFRRGLLLAGLLYILGHEYGHIIDGHPAQGSRNAALVVRNLREPRSESHVLQRQQEELKADAHAQAILSALELDARRRNATEIGLSIAAMGAVLVLTLQSALWWMSLARGSKNYGWTHPAPDVRFGAWLSEDQSPQSQATRRFAEWLWDVLRIQTYMTAAS